MIASNFAFLFAPLFYFSDPRAGLNSKEPTTIAFVLVADPHRVFAVGDVLLLIGAVLLSAAVALVLPGLLRPDRRPPKDAFLWGSAAVVAMGAWAVATLAAQSRARGGLSAVVAMGGWSTAALALLVASALYVVFTVRVGGKSARRGLAPLRWPVYAALGLVGTAFLKPSPQAGEWVVVVGLGLMIVLLPLLGVMTYLDVRSSFDEWAKMEDRRSVATVLHSPAPASEDPPPPTDI